MDYGSIKYLVQKTIASSENNGELLIIFFAFFMKGIAMIVYIWYVTILRCHETYYLKF